MTGEEISEVEYRVNAEIKRAEHKIEKRTVPFDEARQMGAMALFGEKYGDEVRVIRFGDSVELCGGTHVESTGQIGLFKIVSESSIASGIRRIEAITSDKALAWYQDKEKTLRKVEEILDNPQDIVKAVSTLLDEKNSLQKQVEKYNREFAGIFKANLMKNIRKTDRYSLITGKAESIIDNAAILKDISFQLKSEIDDLVLIIGALIGGKPFLAIAISDKLIRERKLHAGEIVKVAAREFEGGGGGQPFFATAGGKLPEKLDGAMDKALDIVLAQFGQAGNES